jgi:hypothetical protein
MQTAQSIAAALLTMFVHDLAWLIAPHVTGS